MGSDKMLFRHNQPHGQGDVFMSWQTGGSAMLLATTGSDATVAVFNRQGQLQERIVLPGLCIGFGWDSDGDLLGIITANSLQVLLWEANSGKKQTLDLGLRDAPSCIIWAKRGPVLAIATARGNLSLYDYSTTKRLSVIGKHNKRITCGCWSNEGLLALASEDKNLSVSTSDGDTLRVIPLRDNPHDITFAGMKTDERVPGENTISVILGKKTLFLYNLLDPDNPIELGFQAKYGQLQVHKWFGDGYILLGFGAGHIVAISTHMQEVGQELFMVKSHRGLLDLALCLKTGEVATCGDTTVKVQSTTNLHETVSIITPVDDTIVSRVAWNDEGSLLALTTSRGALQVHVTHLQVIGAACAPAVAVLSSIAEITVYQYSPDKGHFPTISLPLEIEPSFVALGPMFLACGMNNRAWLYELPSDSEDPPLLLGEREFLSNIDKMFINSQYTAVLTGEKVILQMIVTPEELAERETATFPDASMEESVITCLYLTQYFLVYGTDLGHVVLFSLLDWGVVRELRHDGGIKGVYSDPTGTWIVLYDDRGHGLVYSPAYESAVIIPDFPSACKGAIWDHNFSMRHVFIVYDATTIYLYVYIGQAVHGTRVEKICTAQLSKDQEPLLLSEGIITLITSGGKIAQFDIANPESEFTNESTSSLLSSATMDSIKALDPMLKRQMALRRFHEAWDICQSMDNKEMWEKLGLAAIEHLDIEFAIRVYQQLEDVSMVWSLEDISSIEELHLLCGHCASLLGSIEDACRYFVLSSQPQEALWLRRDLLQWDLALDLAKKIDSNQLPFIAREYATQLEFLGNYQEALVHYNQGLVDQASAGDSKQTQLFINNGNLNLDEHNALCRSGIARNSIRTGDIKRGIALATTENNKLLFKECAEILHSLKHTSDAATLYELAGCWDQAAALYISIKSWTKVAPLLNKVNSTKIHTQYAQAKESVGQYEDAVVAYMAAKDTNSVIRIHLEHLNDPHAAVELLEHHQSAEGAKMVARFYQRINDHDSALRFLVLSGCNTEAFDVARRHGMLREFGVLLLNGEGTPADFKQLAEHFETQGVSLLAGKYYFHGREFHKAMKHLLRASALSSEENEALSLAVDTVASSNDEKLAAQLIEFLLGETDGIPKDAKYLFRLYMARKQFKEAAKTAVIIANQEQINGNYRNAHDVLFSMYQELRHNGIPVPSDMRNSLSLLHSYILVRLHVRRGDHDKGARLLLRVASNISKFPQHIVPILTSTVIECHRAGLKQSAFSYAAMLMRPEYRSQVDPKYSKKIETIVRKTRNPKDIDAETDEGEPSSPCPYCDCNLPDTQVTCTQCKMTIPFCIATGRHIIKDDLTACPECDFPAIRSEFIRILDTEKQCPMCSENISESRLLKIDDPKPYLKVEE